MLGWAVEGVTEKWEVPRDAIERISRPPTDTLRGTLLALGYCVAFNYEPAWVSTRYGGHCDESTRADLEGIVLLRLESYQ